MADMRAKMNKYLTLVLLIIAIIGMMGPRNVSAGFFCAEKGETCFFPRGCCGRFSCLATRGDALDLVYGKCG